MLLNSQELARGWYPRPAEGKTHQYSDTSCESVRPVQGSKIPKSKKEGFGVKNQKPPFPPTPEKGSRVKKSPFLYRAPQEKWGFF